LNENFQLYTSSYDCTVRSLSFVSGSSKEVFANEEGNLISSIDLPPTGQELWISDTSGGVTHVDLREEESKARKYGLSDNKIGSVSVNPTRTHFLLTASNSRIMKYVYTISSPWTAHWSLDFAEYGMHGSYRICP